MTKAVKETAALAHVALDEVERLRARVKELEDALALALKSRRTPGTVEVCVRCGRNAGYYAPTCKQTPCPVAPQQEVEP